jgi:TPR repeat protein
MGDPTALGSIGHMYMLGVGVAQSNETARHYFSQGAEKGCVRECLLGWVGLGVGSALFIGRRGASGRRCHTLPLIHNPPPPTHTHTHKHRDPASLNGMGHLYMHGMGMARDMERAMQYLQKAAHDKGHAESHYNLGLIYSGIVEVEEAAEAAAASSSRKKKKDKAEEGVRRAGAKAQGVDVADLADLAASAQTLKGDPALAHMSKETLEMMAEVAAEAFDDERGRQLLEERPEFREAVQREVAKMEKEVRQRFERCVLGWWFVGCCCGGGVGGWVGGGRMWDRYTLT